MQEKIADLLRDINGKTEFQILTWIFLKMICLIPWELHNW